MQKISLFLLGKKGYQVLNAAVSGGFKELLQLVIVGEDGNIQDDFSKEIEKLCEENTIPYCSRKNFIYSFVHMNTCIAIAAGWRWLIKCNFKQIIVIHDSLLPKYRGFNPLVTALLNKDEEVGVT